jgi:hypothetical protein
MVWSVLAWIVSFEMDLCIVSNMEFLNRFSLLRCGVAHAPQQNLTHQKKLVSLQIGFGNYDVFQNNCENFALYCEDLGEDE